MTKQKTPLSRSPDLSFLSSLPLLEAVRLLNGLAAPATRVVMTQVDADTWRFAIGYVEPDQKRPGLVIIGRLRRWHGTFTRLDATSRLYRQRYVPASKVSRRDKAGAVAIAIFILAGCALISMLIYPPASITSIVVFSVAGLVVGSMIMAKDLEHPDSRIERYLTYLRGQRLRPVQVEIFEDLDRIFKLAGDVSQNEDDLDPSDDLGAAEVLKRLDFERLIAGFAAQDITYFDASDGPGMVWTDDLEQLIRSFAAQDKAMRVFDQIEYEKQRLATEELKALQKQRRK